VNFILFDSTWRYITASFTIDEELTMTSMFSNAFAFHEDLDVVFMFAFFVMASPPPLAVCRFLRTYVNM